MGHKIIEAIRIAGPDRHTGEPPGGFGKDGDTDGTVVREIRGAWMNTDIKKDGGEAGRGKTQVGPIIPRQKLTVGPPDRRPPLPQLRQTKGASKAFLKDSALGANPTVTRESCREMPVIVSDPMILRAFGKIEVTEQQVETTIPT